MGSGEDFETGNAPFELTVRASDGALSVDTTVTVTVTDVLETSTQVVQQPPSFAVSGYGFTLPENADGGTTRVSLGAVSAEDPEGETLVYSIEASNGSGLFEIDASSGELFYVGAGEDFEAGAGPFELTVRASDGELSADVTVTVIVADVQEAPAFGQQAYAFDLAENADGSTSRVSLGTVVASDPDADTLAYSIAGGNQSGLFEIDAASGELFYVGAGEDFEAGTAPFELTVRASDGDLSVDTTVTVSVTNEQEAPGFDQQSYALDLEENEDGSANRVSLGTVVATDPDGNILAYSIEAGNASGLFEIDSASGELFYVGTGEDFEAGTGPFELTVRASDGNLSVHTTVTVSVTDVEELPAVRQIAGTEGEDYLTSGEDDESMTGGAGDDVFVFHPNNGNDAITDFANWFDRIDLSAFSTMSGFSDLTVTQDGNDTVIDLSAHGGGTIRLQGFPAANLNQADFLFKAIEGDEEHNSLSGGIGDDTIRGGGGNDVVSGGSGDDTLYGDEGDDVLLGGTDNDRLFGGEGNDTLYGDWGNDTLYGGSGSDSISGEEGDDSLHGGAATDEFVFYPGDGDDVITDFANGEDIIRLSGFPDGLGFEDLTITSDATGVMIDLADHGGGTILLEGFDINDLDAGDFEFLTHQRIEGGEEDDTIEGGDGDDQLIGHGGDDVLSGGQGDDWMQGNGGNDTLYGERGDDLAQGQEGDDTLYGGEGNDELEGGEGVDLLYGGEGDDELEGGSGDDTLHGGEGDDTLRGDQVMGAHGDDVLHGGDGDDSLFGNEGSDTLYGDEGNDVLHGGDGGDTLEGGTGNDSLSGGFGDDTLHGGEGDDRLDGNDGDDVLYGGAGNDSFDGDSYGSTHYGDDTIYGGEGDDHARGRVGADTIYGEGGNDQLYGGDDNDRLYGGDGADLLHGNDGHDRLYGGADADQLIGNDGDDRLEGGEGSDTLYGHDGNDTLVGGGEQDELRGGSGNDKLEGGEGDDWLAGGGGEDTFVFSAGHGNDWVEDFSVAEDRIDLTQFSDISGIEDLSISPAADLVDGVADAVIDLTGQGGGSIILENVDVDGLDASSFLFSEGIPRNNSEPTDEDFSADTSTTGRVAVDGSVTGGVGSAGDRDWFAVEFVAGRTYTIDLRGMDRGNGTLSDPYLYGIHDADGNLISGTTNNDGGEGYNSRVAFTATESGTHYIAAGLQQGTGGYNLEVTDTSPPGLPQAPVFGQQDYAFELVENANGSATRVSLSTVAATDPEGESVQYSLVGGNVSGLFEIGGSSGELFYVGSGEDFEAGSGPFELTVRASDGDLFSDATITVSVTDEAGNEAPVFDEQGYVFNLAKNTDGSTDKVSLGTVLAPDPEGATVTYSLVSGNEDGVFEIDAVSGEVFYVGTGEDPELSQYGEIWFSLGVQASDGETSSTAFIFVGVTDAQEPPTFAQQEYAFEVAENTDGSTIGVSLGTVVATDPDGDTLAYSIEAGDASGLFEIDAASGELFYVGTGEDFEAGNAAFELTVRASDGNLFTDTTVTVSVGDVPEDPVEEPVDPPVQESVSEPDGADFSRDATTEGRIAVGDSVTGNIGSPGDRDWFAVEFEAGHSYQIDLKGSPTGDGTLVDPLFRGIYDEDGTFIPFTSDDDGGYRRNSRETFTADEDGTYYVAAGAYRNNQGTYTLSVEEVQDGI